MIAPLHPSRSRSSRAAGLLAGGERDDFRTLPAIFAATRYERQIRILSPERLNHATGDICDVFHNTGSFQPWSETTTEGVGSVRKAIGEIRNV